MTALIVNDAMAIGAGAVLGAMSRHHVGKLASEWIATDPNRLGSFSGYHTAAINIGGSFILGGVAGAPVAQQPSLPTPKGVGPASFGLTPRAKLMLGVGFCGSFTTFSTYSVDVVSWIAKGEASKAAAYVMVNNVGGILAAASGLMLVKKIFGA